MFFVYCSLQNKYSHTLPCVQQIKFFTETSLCEDYEEHKKDEKTFHIGKSFLVFFVAGPAGFEPSSAGVKVLCLTAWRWPNDLYEYKRLSIISDSSQKAIALHSKFGKSPSETFDSVLTCSGKNYNRRTEGLSRTKNKGVHIIYETDHSDWRPSYRAAFMLATMLAH